MRKINFMDPETIQKNIAKAASMKDKYYMIILTLSHTGMRASELTSMKVQDVDFNANYIIIRGKGDKMRNIDISPQLSQQLQLYIKNKNLSSKKRIFDITRQRVHQICKIISSKNPHAFRHSYAINLLRETGNIRYVQKQLGHSSMATTQIYLDFIEYDKEKEKLASLYSWNNFY